MYKMYSGYIQIPLISSCHMVCLSANRFMSTQPILQFIVLYMIYIYIYIYIGLINRTMRDMIKDVLSVCVLSA